MSTKPGLRRLMQLLKPFRASSGVLRRRGFGYLGYLAEGVAAPKVVWWLYLRNPNLFNGGMRRIADHLFIDASRRWSYTPLDTQRAAPNNGGGPGTQNKPAAGIPFDEALKQRTRTEVIAAADEALN